MLLKFRCWYSWCVMVLLEYMLRVIIGCLVSSVVWVSDDVMVLFRFCFCVVLGY